MEKLQNLLLIFLIIVLPGCATVIHGPSQRVPVSSDPSGAVVQIDGSGSWKTPTTLKLERKMDHILIVSKEGYEQEEIVIMHVISGAVAGNILAGGLIGWGVDAMTGAQYRLVPDRVHIELKSLRSGSPEGASEMIRMTPDEKLRRLKELLDQKLITQEEYEVMRKIILDSITKELSESEKSVTPVRSIQGRDVEKTAPAEIITQEGFVYVSPWGGAYHQINCASLSGEKRRISLKEAKERTYIPCSVCNPPR